MLSELTDPDAIADVEEPEVFLKAGFGNGLLLRRLGLGSSNCDDCPTHNNIYSNIALLILNRINITNITLIIMIPLLILKIQVDLNSDSRISF